MHSMTFAKPAHGCGSIADDANHDVLDQKTLTTKGVQISKAGYWALLFAKYVIRSTSTPDAYKAPDSTIPTRTGTSV